MSSRQHRLPICPFSLVSIRIAEISLKQEASFGKIPTTLVRLRISRLTRSRLFVVRMNRQCFVGKLKTVNPSAKFASSQVESRGADLAYFWINVSRYFSAENRSGALKMLRKLAPHYKCRCICSHFSSHALSRDISTCIMLKVKLAALPSNTTKDTSSSKYKPFVSATSDQFDTSQSAIFQALQETSPSRSIPFSGSGPGVRLGIQILSAPVSRPLG